MNSARLIFLQITVLTLLLIPTAIIALALHGESPMIAIGSGVLWGLVPVGFVLGIAELAAPAWTIRWRERLMASDNPLQRRVGDFFSGRLAISGPRPWENANARNRVRMFGLAQTAFWLITVILLIWISLRR